MKAIFSELSINAPAKKVVAAFLDIRAMREWWGIERGLVEPRSGGVWALTWDRSESGFRYINTAIVAAYRPGELLHLQKLLYLNPDRVVLGPMELRIWAEEHSNYTNLTVQQDGFGEGDDWAWYYDTVHRAWPVALKLLKRYLEEGLVVEVDERFG